MSTAGQPQARKFIMPWPSLWLCTLGIVVCLAVSEYALLAMGIHYQTKGGNLLIKVHPASWIIVAAFGIFALSRAPNPVCLATWIRDRYGMFLFLGTGVGVLIYKLITGGASGAAFLIDSFIVPSALALMLLDASPTYRRRLAGLIVMLLVINALAGIIEAKLHVRIFPYVQEGKPVEEAYFRATAFGGHPLRNAMLTACALIALVGTPWPLLIRIGCGGMLGLGALAFGGRTAAGVGAAGMLCAIAARLNIFMRRSPASMAFTLWLGMILLVPIGASAAALLMETNFGARIRNGDLGDASAMTRVRLTDLVQNIDFTSLLTGYSPDGVVQVMLASHLGDIECFWVYMLLYLGLLAFPIWLAGLLGGLRAIGREMDFAGRIIVVCVLLIASTSVSLSSKDTILDVVFALALGVGLPQRGRSHGQAALPSYP